MTRWNGPAYKGAMREVRAEKRAEAEKRNENGSWRHSCGHKHSFEQSVQCAVAVDYCSCGRKSWLMPGADGPALDEYYRENADHAQMCEVSL